MFDKAFERACNDFERDNALQLMHAMGWKWATGLPSSYLQLKDHVEDMFKSMNKERGNTVSCGGFKISILDFPGEPDITIEFIALSSSGYEDDEAYGTEITELHDDSILFKGIRYYPGKR